MAKTYGPTKPYLLGQPDNISQGGALYDSALTGDSVYEAFDLCEVTAAGALRRVTAPGATTRYCLANKDWNQPFASTLYKDRRTAGEEWYRRMGLDDNIVFQLSVAWAESLRGTNSGLQFNATDKVCELTGSTTNGALVILAPVFEVTDSANPGSGMTAPAQQRYEVGDLKVPVICRWIEGKVA